MRPIPRIQWNSQWASTGPGATGFLIRPFQLGDIFLIQRLGRQATKLNAIQALVQPCSPFGTAFSSLLPLDEHRVATYVLHQEGHRLARAGFLQMRRRAHSAEAEIMLLAPGLDTPSGHPAIWEKLLSHAVQEAARQGIARVYVDVPEQPLPVSCFVHVGFKSYAHETIWRLVGPGPHPGSRPPATLRPFLPGDAWSLSRLYARVTPGPVRQAEGANGDGDRADRSPIVEPRFSLAANSYVMLEHGEICGAFQLVRGSRGAWLQLWVNTLDPDQSRQAWLLHFALATARAENPSLPLYTGVAGHQEGMNSLLYDYGFAPFTDRAKMVRPVMQWVREPVPAYSPAHRPVGEAVTTPFALPTSPQPSYKPGATKLGSSTLRGERSRPCV